MRLVRDAGRLVFADCKAWPGAMGVQVETDQHGAEFFGVSSAGDDAWSLGEKVLAVRDAKPDSLQNVIQQHVNQHNQTQWRRTHRIRPPAWRQWPRSGLAEGLMTSIQMVNGPSRGGEDWRGGPFRKELRRQRVPPRQ